VVLISGIALIDIIGSGLERMARPGELAFCSVRTSLGGHACNVSGDLVRLGFPRSRLRVVFPAGRDLAGDLLVRGLKRQGLRVEPVFADEAPTSIDLILVAKGEDRRYHADPGANVEMSAAPVIALLEKHRPLIYYAGGVGLLGRLDSHLAEVLRRAKELGALTFVDVVSPYRKTWGFLRKALPWTDFFHCNADEAASLVGETEAAKAAGMIRRLGAKAVFLTLGGEGALASVPGALIRVPAFSVRVKDPTGAGDAFSAGLILKTYGSIGRGISPGRFSTDDWLDILLYASACGAVCTTGIGTTAAVDAKKVEALIRRQGGSLSRTVRVCPNPPQPLG
jgi:sugar/nucleoside kinase (ribokinase family)